MLWTLAREKGLTSRSRGVCDGVERTGARRPAARASNCLTEDSRIPSSSLISPHRIPPAMPQVPDLRLSFSHLDLTHDLFTSSLYRRRGRIFENGALSLLDLRARSGLPFFALGSLKCKDFAAQPF